MATALLYAYKQCMTKGFITLTHHVLLRRISCVGIYVASMITGKGPYSLLLEHVRDPIHHNAVQNLL